VATGSPAMILCVAGAVVFLALFVRQEKRAAAPLVDLRLFRNPTFAAGIVGVALGYALLYGMLFLMAFALQKGLNNSATVAASSLPSSRWCSDWSHRSASRTASARRRAASGRSAWRRASPPSRHLP
jgi:hypothetical protein